MEVPDTNHRIIDGAAALFFTLGFSKVTMEEIADSVGCTKKTIYNHFPTKLDLLDAVITASVREIVDTLEEISGDPDLDFFDKLTRGLQYVFVQLSVKKRNLLDDFSKYTAEFNTATLETIRNKLIPIILRLVDEGIEEGLVRETVSREMVPYTYLSLVWGEIVLFRQFEIEFNPGELLLHSIKHTLGGILTPQGTATLLEKGDTFEKE